MADTLTAAVTLTYLPASATQTVENPVYYLSTTAPTQKISGFITAVTGSSTTISLATFVTNTMVSFIQNLDATNYVTVTLRPNGQSVDTAFQVDPGGFLYFGGALVLSRNILVQAHTASCQTYYYVAGV